MESHSIILEESDIFLFWPHLYLTFSTIESSGFWMSCHRSWVHMMSCASAHNLAQYQVEQGKCPPHTKVLLSTLMQDEGNMACHADRWYANRRQEPEYNLPLPSHGSSLGNAFQNEWDPPLLLASFLKQCLDLTKGTRKQISQQAIIRKAILPAPPLWGYDSSWLRRTLLFQLVNVPHYGSEEGSLVGIIVHAASHKVS